MVNIYERRQGRTADEIAGSKNLKTFLYGHLILLKLFFHETSSYSFRVAAVTVKEMMY